MARRRRFYARDRRGRFARTAGGKGVYKKKLSKKKKLAIGGAVVVGVGAAALGGRELYRAGGRKGWEIGKRQGIYEGKPLRGKNGRMRPNSEKRDYSQNPFAPGMRPVGPMGAARPRPSAGTRIRASAVGMHRIDQNFSEGKKRTDGMHVRRRNRERIAGARRAASNAAKRYNDAQSRSQTIGDIKSASRSAARAGRRVSDSARLQGLYASERAGNAARRGAANAAATVIIGSTRKGRVRGVPAAAPYSAVGHPFAGQKVGKARSSRIRPSAKRNQRNRKRKKK